MGFRQTRSDLGYLSELDPTFEVLPIVRRMMPPVISKEITELAARVKHDLPDVAGDYAKTLHELHTVIRRLLETEQSR